MTVLDGNINIKSVCDGIDSENATEIYGGTFDITTTGDILEVSSKGISSDISLEISGGNIKLNTTDKAIKSDGAIHITGGEININSAHKGISGIGDVTIDGGNIYIGNATEGIESKQTVTINGGDIYMNVSDDGLNSGADVIYSENPEKSAASKRPNTLIINGGNIEVYAQDDCIDSNAAAIFNGGIIKAARHRGEVIDTGAAPLTITNGATLIYTSQAEYAAENPNNVQNSVAFISNTQEENTKIIFEDSLGNEIVSFCPASKFEAVTITSPEIEIGNSYALIVGNTRYDVTANKKFTIISNSSGQKTSSTTNFEGKSFSMGGDEKIGYWLFTPQNATKNMPLIVYLHGSHGQGDDLSVVLQEDFVKMVSDGEFDDTPAYILIPQLSDKYKSWSRINSELIGLMDNVVNTYGINKNNISLMGYSLGGTGTVNLASAYPSYFSRIAILSGSARTTNDAANRLSGISVWAFVGSEDVIVKPEGAISLVEALKQNGEDARITVFDGADHIEVPPLVFSDGKINLVNWLIGK